MPGLERVTGEPPPLLAVDPVQRDDRLLLAVRAFLGGLATADEPLLLFIDDLQWADAATLEVLASLVAGGSDLGPVLLVLACRPEETAAVEAARTLVAAVAAGAPTQLVLNVPPLPLEVVQTLFAETFHVDAPATRALAELLVGKTAGNPLFLRRLLRFLQQAGLLSRNPGTGVWGWSAVLIAAVQVTDNVVELLTLTLRTLPIRSSSCWGSPPASDGTSRWRCWPPPTASRRRRPPARWPPPSPSAWSAPAATGDPSCSCTIASCRRCTPRCPRTAAGRCTCVWGARCSRRRPTAVPTSACSPSSTSSAAPATA